MTFTHYGSILRKQWRLILACILLAGLGSFLVSTWLTPLYQATTLIQVTVRTESGQTDYNSLLASNQLVQTEAQLALSDAVLREVASHYSGLTADQLLVSTTPRVNTQLFSIDVRHTNAALAAQLANDIALTFIKQQKDFAQANGLKGKDFLYLVQAAHAPTKPAQPDIRLNTVWGVIGGLFLGLLLALFYEQVDTRLRTPEEVMRLLNWPLLGTIQKAFPSKESIINPIGRSPNVEAYRILRTNIGFSGIDKPLQTLAVASATAHEGKSVIAANLAIYMAKAGRNTLLIDADMRCPSLYEKFGLPSDKLGLSNAIVAYAQQLLVPSSAYKHGLLPRIALEPFMHDVGILNLRVMPSGPLPSNPSELLDSKGMERFFASLLHCGAEMIIFDTPPLLGIADAAILLPKVDGTLFVIDINRASRSNLGQAKAILNQAGAHVLGCILNKCPYRRKDNAYTIYQRSLKLSTEDLSGKNRQYPSPVC